MKISDKKTKAVKFPFGVDISGYRRYDGTEPFFAVLCPECSAGRIKGLRIYWRRYWREQALNGTALTPSAYNALNAKCEACEKPSTEWTVPLYIVTDNGEIFWNDKGQYRNDAGEPVVPLKTKDGRVVFLPGENTSRGPVVFVGQRKPHITVVKDE